MQSFFISKTHSMHSTIDLTSQDGTKIPAYVARPQGIPRAAVVVLQEIFGVNSHIKAVADGYAAAGYYAVAPYMFHRVQAGVDLGYTDADMQAAFALKGASEQIKDKLMQDIQAAINHASGLVAGSETGGKVAVTGFCWGGLLTWRAASQLSGVAAAVPYYGGGMHHELGATLRCPTMAHLSDNDSYLPMDGVAALQAAHPEVQVHLYSAHHGFNCDQRGSYQAEAAALAKQRTLDFLAEHLS